MQLLPLAFGGAAAGAGSLIGTLGTVIGGVTSFMEASYKSKVAASNAQIAEQNATQATHTAALQAQQQDIEAQQELGDVVAQASASGLELGVGSAALRRKSKEELAAKDRGFTIYAGQKEAAGYKQQANEFRAESKAAKTGGFLGLLGSAVELATPNFVSDAPKVSAATARRVVRPKRNPIYAGV